MNKNQQQSYYSYLKGTIVQITRLERYATRFAIGILALTLVLVVLKG